MKIRLLLLLPIPVVGIHLCSVVVSRAADHDVPDVVTEGMDAYVSSGSAAAAVRAWLKGSPVETQQGQLAKSLQNIETLYGKMVGWELVRVVPLSPSCRRVYAALKYERGPLWASFDCYKVNEWILPSVLLRTEAKEVFPESILAGAVGP